MNSRTWVIISLLALAPLVRGATNDLTAVLQKGLFEEEANRNLDAAIAEYQSLVSQMDRDRQVAATAVFRLGECYRKLGKTNEAAAQYQRVLKDFSEQQTLVSLSAQNLAGMRGTTAVMTDARPSNGFDDAEALARKLAGLEQFKGDPMKYARAVSVLFPDDTLAKMIAQVPRLREQELHWSKGQFDTILTAVTGEGMEMLNLSVPTAGDAEWPKAEVQRQMDFLAKRSASVVEDQESRLQVLRAVAEPARQSSTVTETPTVTDDEQQEIRRIQAMIRNSPDLINARIANSNNTPLTVAAINGQLSVARFLLESGAEIGVRGERGRTPLILAASLGHRAMVELLLSRGADVNEADGTRNTALHLAAREGFKALVETLLAHQADFRLENQDGETPLQIAVVRGRLEIVKMFLDKGGDANAVNSASAPLLFHAISSPQITGLLLQRGAKPNAPLAQAWSGYEAGTTPLLRVARSANANENVMELLLKNGADPNLADETGRTPLHYAGGNPAIVKLLLAAGAPVNVKDVAGFTPLHWAACATTNAASAALLVPAGAEVNAVGTNGFTPLHLAAWKNDEAIVAVLLTHKADPNISDREGKTPFDLAKEPVVNLSGVAPGITWPSKPQPGMSLPLASRLPSTKIQTLLINGGAAEFRPRPDCIAVQRASANFSQTIFSRAAHDWNRFTLIELILNAYDHRRPGSMSFPDLAHVVVLRYGNSGSPRRIEVNLLNAAGEIDCSRDVPLEFGDAVEIPEREHALGEKWEALTDKDRNAMVECRKGTVQLVVRNRKVNLPVYPNYSSIVASVLDQKEARDVLLSSSDLARVKVTRPDPQTGKTRETIVDCSNPNHNFSPQLWLRDGDVIEVPEKKQNGG